VGRDRQWAVFERQEGAKNSYKLKEANPKGHSRMILDAAWAPTLGEKRFFATAGRDKVVKIWGVGEDEEVFSCKLTIPEDGPVTAIDFLDVQLEDGRVVLAVGTEVGKVRVYYLDLMAASVSELELEFAR
jgi:elongator complex protein 2